ncbi:BREX system P-loop protein BrxC [Laribacter hongkongensis]|uniref:BREX system P-loop protein BrxC n=1 Tax=Laribacter hongkongensis TaxID=168471 RepID=UPI001EFD47F1|nr:BREX system P-loop protein BrxC [Laribacter hongkongensis]MCG9000254.1 BREX system P-loop protein BrxC [Laribacter hongkongensis]MCG9006644.1 BREX system P-loop protein BrxC [Laribacter hongkongensis]MCG9015686.1 BREX system P-loop protein BrxC [Laribacter hongkongensis]
MKIKDLFKKDIARPINGVIKADQRDSESIWQELDEYVVTPQLNEYYRRFFDTYLAGYDRPGDPVIASRMGAWVSGFFGSGKSHFIKILSYLLENIEAIDPVSKQPKRAVEFFDEKKVADPMLRADFERAARFPADVILFNIDAKADSKSDRDVILQVFLRVFNEKLGFSGDAAHIANMERYLQGKGAYQAFRQAFEQSNGNSWEAERDAVDFLRDDVVTALSTALKMSEQSAADWFDNARDSYRINIESFAALVNDYLQDKPANHRILFLVDEVGQFIGDNTQLMLNLQTITEQLGTLCHGRAWVVVTSQEDIDAAIGEANKAKSQDFSKIQGRFHTRLSLASSNTDDVIGERLLAKTEDAHRELRDVFAAKGDIINNQLAFSSEGVTLRSYKDASDYVKYYPFAPYQFTLLSKIFEAIRRHGATGKHLSKGERSLLDAFQTAAKRVISENIDCMVPLHEFYPSIESFLETTIKHSIDNAEKQVGELFEPFDLQLLKTLFLIKYIPEIVKGSVDNLATLCVDEIDADKLVLKRQIQDSLARLEKENLVNRNGDDWMFLTHEEQDIAREIGHETVSSDEQAKKLASLVFDDLLKGKGRVRHRDSKGDYDFNRLLDGKPWRPATHELTLEIITELNDDFNGYTDAKCRLNSAGGGRALLRLPAGERLYEELLTFLKVEQYIASKYDNASAAGKKILAFKKDENRDREDRLRLQLETLIGSATLYACGEVVALKSTSPEMVLDEAINYLVTNTYTKLGYLRPTPNPLEEIRAVLAADSVQSASLFGDDAGGYALALKEVGDFLHLKTPTGGVTLEDVVGHFTRIPYGWKPEWEIVHLVARLFMAGEITLMQDGTALAAANAFEPLSKSVRFKQVTVLKRKKTGALELKKARDLFKELFASLASEDEDRMVADFRTQWQQWQTRLTGYHAVASQGGYPGLEDIEAIQGRVRKQLGINDSAAFIEALLKSADDWRDAEEDLQDLTGFYDKEKGQIHTWRRMQDALQGIAPNRDKLQEDAKVAAALQALDTLCANPRPYGQINKIDALLGVIDQANQQLAAEVRTAALQQIDQKIAAVVDALTQLAAPADVSNRVLSPLQKLRQSVAQETSVPQIYFLLQQRAGDLLDTAMDEVGDYQASQATRPVPPAPQPAPVTGGGNTATVVQPTTVSPAKPLPRPAPIKPSKTVRAAQLTAGKLYLENETEVEDYLQRLRDKLMGIVHAGERVRIE